MRVCVIESDRTTYGCIANAFADVEWFPSAEAFLRQRARQAGPLVVIANMNLPGIDGVQLVQRLRKVGDAVPVILVGEDADVVTAVRAIKHGANDFLEKRSLSETLVHTVRQLLERKNGHG